MTSNKKAGIVMVIISSIGVLYSLITINSELNVKYTYSAPFTDHEIFVIFVGIVSLGLLIAGIALISAKKDSGSSSKPEKVTPVSSTKTPVKETTPYETKLEGDLVRKLKKNPELRSVSDDSSCLSEKESRKKIVPQKTLDETYASEHGFWICPRDETMVPNSDNSCPVCGYSRL